jgi:hypothetical protein
MKKKMYNQPLIQAAELMPMTIICVSAGDGGDAPGDTIGD